MNNESVRKIVFEDILMNHVDENGYITLNHNLDTRNIFGKTFDKEGNLELFVVYDSVNSNNVRVGGITETFKFPLTIVIMG